MDGETRHGARAGDPVDSRLMTRERILSDNPPHRDIQRQSAARKTVHANATTRVSVFAAESPEGGDVIKREVSTPG